MEMSGHAPAALPPGEGVLGEENALRIQSEILWGEKSLSP